MEEKTIDGKRRVNIVATVKLPTRVRISYEVTDEEQIMPILEQILEQKRRSLEANPPHNSSEKKTIPPALPKKTSKLSSKIVTRH